MAEVNIPIKKVPDLSSISEPTPDMLTIAVNPTTGAVSKMPFSSLKGMLTVENGLNTVSGWVPSNVAPSPTPNKNDAWIVRESGSTNITGTVVNAGIGDVFFWTGTFWDYIPYSEISPEQFVGMVAEIRDMEIAPRSIITTDFGGGYWFLSEQDAAETDDTGNFLKTSGGMVYKRIQPRGFTSIEYFGAVADYDFVTNTGTDNGPFIQKAIDYIVRIGGGEVFVPPGFYFIASDIFINKDVAVPVMLTGRAGLMKDYQNTRRGPAFLRNNPGAIIKLNLKADGTPYAAFDSYCLNVAIEGISFEAPTGLGVKGIEGYRVRGSYRNLGFKKLYAGIFQDNLPPAGYVDQWNNYSDQSIYDNLRMFNMREYGLYVTHADASVFNALFYEYPLQESIYGIRIHYSFGFNLTSVLHSNGNHVITNKPDSAFIMLDQCRGFHASGFHLESVEFAAVFDMDRCIGGHVTGIHERFASLDMFRLRSCRSMQLTNLHGWTNPKAAGYYDINDIGSLSTGIMFWGFYLTDFDTFVVKQPIINRTLVAEFGELKTFQAVQDIVYDKYVTASFTYPGPPNYSTTIVTNLILPAVTQNTVVQLPSSADNSGKTMVIFNRNASTFTTTIQGSLRKPDGTTTSLFPISSVMIIKSDGTAWNIISIYQDYPRKASPFEVLTGTDDVKFTTALAVAPLRPKIDTATAPTLTKAGMNAAYPANQNTGVACTGYQVVYANNTGGGKVLYKMDNAANGNWFMMPDGVVLT